MNSTITRRKEPGNTKTEELIKYFQDSSHVKNAAIKKLSLKFSKLKMKYKWGINKYYNLSEIQNTPTYVQTMLSDERYKKNDYISVIKYLK